MDKWLNHPTAIKIMALVIGIIMWAVVHFDSEDSPNNVASLYENRKIDGVKVETYGLDERLYVLKSIEPQTVNLTVRGTTSDLFAARKENYHITVDLRSLEAGTHKLPVQWDLPRGIQFVEASPNMVTVELEALQTKEYEIEIRTTGTPAEGFMAGTPILKPTNRVHVTLPENTMAQVGWVGAVLSIDKEKESIKNKSIKLSVFDENNNVIEDAVLDPAVVEVEVPITFPFKTVPVQFIMTGRMPVGLSIGTFETETEQVTVYGTKETLDNIEFIEAELKLDELTQSGKVTLPLSVPQSVEEISPSSVSINVEVVLSDTRTLEGLPINWKGLGEGMSMTILEPATGKADIVIKGSPSRLGRLQPGDVTVDADLTGKGPGIHTVQLIVNSPRFIEQSGGTNTALVEISLDEPVSAVFETSEGSQANTRSEGFVAIYREYE